MLSMNEVLLYLMRVAKPVVDNTDLGRLAEMSVHQWQDWVDNVRGMVITRPGLVGLSKIVDLSYTSLSSTPSTIFLSLMM